MTTGYGTMAGWAVILALMAAVPHSVGGSQEEPVLLRLAPAAGSEAVFETVDTTRMTVEAVGSATFVETSVRRMTVAQASGDLRLLKIVVESTDREHEGSFPPEALDQFWNTRDTALGSGRIVVAHVLGPAFESVRLEDSVQLSLDSTWSGVPSLGYPIGGPIELPESPVRVGDSWSASKVPSEPPPGMEIDEDTNTTFRLDSLRVVDGTRRAYISYESEGWAAISGNDPGMGAIEIRTDVAESGAIEMDLESGFVVAHSSLAETTSNYMMGGGASSISATTSVRTRLLPDGR